MKKFNVLVIAAWLAMFALSLRPINGDDSQNWGILDYATYEFNWMSLDVCYSCAYPDEQIIQRNATTNQDEVVDAHNLPVTDNRMTHAILVNTFWFMAFMMGAVNLAFYCGTGDFGRGASTTFRTTLAYGDRLRATIRKGKVETEPAEPPTGIAQLAEES